MTRTSSSFLVRRIFSVAVLASIATAPIASHQRAARNTPTVPLLVALANRPPVLIAAPSGSNKLRAVPVEGRLPTTDEPIRTFAAGEIPASSMLLAESQGRVLGYSPVTGELVLLDVATERSSVLLPPGQLPPGLQDLEFSPRGIAVLSLFGDSTTLFVVSVPKSLEERATWATAILPIRASDTAFSLRGLLVLSEEQHALFEIPAVDLPQPKRRATTPRINAVLKDLPSPAVAVAEWRDVFYVSFGQNLLVVPREMPVRGSVTPIPGMVARTDALRVSDNYLVTADFARGRIAISHRPVPATIRFHGDARDTTARLLHVFELLARYGMLPTRSIAVDRDTPLELMVAHRVLPALAPDAMTDDLRKRLESILCVLNASSCSPLRLTRGSELRVPNVPLNEQLVTTRERFRDRTLEEVLRERLWPQHRPADHDLLIALLNANRSLDQTLDAKLVRLAFIPWQLAAVTELQPGTTLALKDGIFAIVGQPASCKLEAKSAALPKESTGLDAILQTHRADHLKTLLGIPGVVDVAFGDVELISAPLEGMKGCVEIASGATHLVTDVIRAKPVFLRVRGANAAVQYPEDDKLSAAATYPVKIASTERPEWSAVIDDPVVFGFRAQPLAAASIGSNASIATVPLHDLLRRRFDFLNVPVTGWEPLVFVPSVELAGGTNLRTIQSRGDPLVAISPHQRSASQTTASSVDDAERQPDRPLNDVERRKEGDRIRGLIHYPANPPDASSVVIAVAERSTSVDRQHPDFRRPDGKSVWSKEAEDGGVALEEFPPVKPMDAVERKFSTADDHGTHVAGLLGAVGLPPGLAPQAGLFLVPMESQSSEIRRLLEFAARDIPASIANFSQTFPNDPGVLEEIGGGLDQLADSLLVIAATDNKQQFLKHPLRAPIGWSDGPNIIGVAAADENRQLTIDSDRGKRYVQLLAVGKEVLSLANKGAYARASGASQAAPQVAGAAALLVAAGHRNPAQIKARLIATADWDHNYEDKVWGGFLNVERAIAHLASNVLTRFDLSATLTRSSVNFHSNAKLQLKRSIDYPADQPTPTSPTSDGEIEWAKILRIVRQSWLADSNRERDLHRIVYLGADNDVRIKKNVEFKANQEFSLVRCAPVSGAVPAPSGDPLPAASHCDPLRPEQIEDYVAMFPGQGVRFVRPPQR